MRTDQGAAGQQALVVEDHRASTPAISMSRRFRRSEPARRPTQMSAIESTTIVWPVLGSQEPFFLPPVDDDAFRIEDMIAMTWSGS